MNLTTILLGVIGAITGLFFYTKSKKDTAEALLTNLDTNKQVDKIEAEKLKNSALIAAEEEKQRQAADELQNEKDKNVSKDDLLDFFNNRKP